jgi:hypothetical protein
MCAVFSISSPHCVHPPRLLEGVQLIMRLRFFVYALVALGVLALAGCQQVEPNNPAATKSIAPATTGKIAVTTASEEARAAIYRRSSGSRILLHISTKQSHSIRISHSPNLTGPTSRRPRKSSSRISTTPCRFLPKLRMASVC